jgi:uncharacterized protein YkwD
VKNYSWKQLTTLIIPILILVGGGVLISVHNDKKSKDAISNTTEETNNSPTPLDRASFIEMVNKERLKAGAGDLTSNSALDEAASNRAKDMITKNYFDNTTVDPWSFVKQTDYQFESGQAFIYRPTYGSIRYNEDVFNYFMGDISSKKLLTSASYNDIGFGIANSSDSQSSIVVLYIAKGITPTASTAPSTSNAYNGGSSNVRTYNSSNIDLNPYKYAVPLNAGGTYTSPQVNVSPPTPPPPTSPSYSYAQALSIAQSNCASYGDSSAYQPCVSAYLHKFGY